jgi:arsenite-transporting ATPase
VLVMGKGGVGKTTIAAAVAVGLAATGRKVHLTTTDPAQHLTETLQADMPGLRVSWIDPTREARRFLASPRRRCPPQPRLPGGISNRHR